MSLSSDEINFLVYRYLAESGFSHSAFAFAHESLIARSTVADAEVPPGALISFLAKGLQYVEIESHLQEDGSERSCDEPFTLLSPHVCRLRGATGRAAALADGSDGSGAGAPVGGSEAEARPGDVTTLQGHAGEAFTLAWNQKSGVLASGAGDGTALLWRVPGCTEGALAGGGVGGGGGGEPFATLRHTAGEGTRARKEEGRDVSVLEWSPDGARLLSGCLDGRARLWSAAGALTHTLAQHTGQIYAASWAPSGALVATASVDKTAIVWDAATGDARHAFCFHSAPVLDLAWASDTMFATCSTDKLIHLCGVGSAAPLRTLVGHTDEVNSVRWSPSGALLASGSDDASMRLWSAGGEGAPPPGCVGVGLAHKKPVYAVRWAPTGEGSANAGKAAMLASCSFDGSVRLWDPAAPAKPRLSLQRHSALVYAVAFSPDGDLVAAASADKGLSVWSARDGSLVRTLAGPAACYDTAFSPDGGKLAACFGNGQVQVVDLRL